MDDSFLYRKIQDFENTGSPVNGHIGDDTILMFGIFIYQGSHITDILIIKKCPDCEFVLCLNMGFKLLLYRALFKFQRHGSKVEKSRQSAVGKWRLLLLFKNRRLFKAKENDFRK